MQSIKLELKLNNKERTLLAQHAGYSRFVYNYALTLYNSLDHNEIKGSSSKKLDTIKKFFTNYTKKQPEYDWCNKLSSRVYQNALRNLKTAFSRFFQGLGEYPKYHRKRNNCSFTVDSSNGLVFLTRGKRIKVPTLCTLRLKEGIPFNCVSQTFTISRMGQRWFISFSIDAERLPPRIHRVISPVGLDIGVKTFATLSDGEIIESPMPYRKAKTKLGQLQYRNRHKQLGNRKKGLKQSNNGRKYRQKLSKQHYKVACQRKDFLQKTTTKLCRKYAHLKLENLNISGMMSNHKLASAVADLGAYEFKRQLTYKAEWYASRIDIIDQWFPSSKNCCQCGHKKEDLKLADRIYECSNCGLKIDRDLNASINLENAEDDVIVESIGWVTSEFNACEQ